VKNKTIKTQLKITLTETLLKVSTLTLLGLFLFCSVSFSAGTTGQDFLKIAYGARPSGMGEAFVAVADEPSGMYWNPAGLGFMEKSEVQGMYGNWIGGLYLGYGGIVIPTKAGTIGAGLQYFSGPQIKKISNNTLLGDYTYYDAALTLPYSLKLSSTVSFGINLKGLQNSIDNNVLSALAGDIGIMFKTSPNFTLGASAQNLFGKIGQDNLALTTRVGAAFNTSLNNNFSDILISAEIGRSERSSEFYAAGIEQWFAKVLALRLGYKYVADSRFQSSLNDMASWRAGFGLRIKDLELDYAFQPMADLGDSHRISITWRHGGWTLQEQKEKSVEVVPIVIPKPVVAAQSIIEEKKEGKKTTFTLTNMVVLKINKIDIEPEIVTALNKMAATILKLGKKCKISVEGHTDSTGNRLQNMRLSKARAVSVYEYLLSKGINKDNIQSVEGFAYDRPIDTNDTVQGRAKNRRVEVICVKE